MHPSTPSPLLRWPALTVLVLALSVAAGCGKTESPTGETPAPTTMGTDIDDAALTASIKTALLADESLKSFDVQVETRKAEVQLSGMVDTQAQIDQAVTVARGVNGVQAVDNRITLKPGATTVGEKVDDAVITTKVKAALMNDESVKGMDISVVTTLGEVQLSGFVDNQGQIDRSIEVAKGVEGVQRVQNGMSIKK